MNYAATKNFARVLVVGQGRFGSGLFQGVSSASVRGYSGVEVDHMSAKAFCTLSVNSMAEMLKPYKFLMYAGYNLHAQIAKLSEAMPLASPDATLEILDFTNPEPGAWEQAFQAGIPQRTDEHHFHELYVSNEHPHGLVFYEVLLDPDAQEAPAE